MKQSIITILILISPVCFAQIPKDFPVVDESNLPDAKFKPSRHYTGESLFGYMDGGAELYREYGITDAVITELDFQKKHYKCEMYKMTGAEEAFGIFSVSKYKCPGTPDIGSYACQAKYQLQFCKGPYYVSIINTAGTRADSLFSARIGELISEQIKEKPVDLNTFFPDIEPIDFRLNTILAKGKLGLMNGATRWEDYFRDVYRYNAMIITDKDKTLISVRFNAIDDFKQFLSLHGWGTCDLSINGLKMAGGEIIKLLADTHLLIEIDN